MPLSDAAMRRTFFLSIQIRMDFRNFLDIDFSCFQTNFVCRCKEFNKLVFQNTRCNKYTKPDTSIISTNKLIHDNWVTLSGAVAMYFWEQGKKILLDEKWFSEKVWKDETNPFPLFFWRLFLMPAEERWPFSLTTFVYLILPRVALIHAVLLSKSSKPILLWLFVSINRKRYSSNLFAFHS